MVIFWNLVSISWSIAIILDAAYQSTCVTHFNLQVLSHQFIIIVPPSWPIRERLVSRSNDHFWPIRGPKFITFTPFLLFTRTQTICRLPSCTSRYMFENEKNILIVKNKTFSCRFCMLLPPWNIIPVFLFYYILAPYLLHKLRVFTPALYLNWHHYSLTIETPCLREIISALNARLI